MRQSDFGGLREQFADHNQVGNAGQNSEARDVHAVAEMRWLHPEYRHAQEDAEDQRKDDRSQHEERFTGNRYAHHERWHFIVVIGSDSNPRLDVDKLPLRNADSIPIGCGGMFCRDERHLGMPKAKELKIKLQGLFVERQVPQIEIRTGRCRNTFRQGVRAIGVDAKDRPPFFISAEFIPENDLWIPSRSDLIELISTLVNLDRDSRHRWVEGLPRIFPSQRQSSRSVKRFLLRVDLIDL